MPQPIMIGLIAALGMLAAAILGLVGVLVGTRMNWKLGKRTGDIQALGVQVQQAGVGIQQQTVDIARIEKLSKENEDLRKENQEQYSANRQLRHEAETEETRHKSECAAWETDRRAWDAERGAAASALLAARTRTLALEDALAQSEAACQVALAAQASAEGGLKTAMKTLSELAPCP